MDASAHDLVVSVVREHADALLRTARRHSLCAADAEDAYQRALEVFVKRAGRLDPASAHRWLHVVVRHEALAVREARRKLVAVAEEEALEALDDGRERATVEERSERFEELQRAAEALERLKPQEVTALLLKAQGLSYAEIAERQSWSLTKVNRCLSEGRRAFLARYAGIEAGAECERWAPALSALADGEASAAQLADLRPHLRNCPACRASLAGMQRSRAPLAALVPALPLAGLLRRLWEGAALSAAGAAPAKLAAVAASTLAVAGGGAAIERGEGRAPAPSPARAAAAVAPAPAAPVAARASDAGLLTARGGASGAADSSGSPARRGRPATRSDAPSPFRPAEAAARTGGASPFRPAEAAARRGATSPGAAWGAAAPPATAAAPPSAAASPAPTAAAPPSGPAPQPGAARRADAAPARARAPSGSRGPFDFEDDG